MATEQQNQPGDPAAGTTETASQDQQEQQGQQQAPTSETPSTTEQQPAPEAKADEGKDSEGKKDKDPAKTALLADLRTERDKRQALATENETLKSQLAELTTAKDRAESVQAKYDRLEAFLLAAGGPLSRALDSRSFTQSLFESDADVAELVKKWHRDNPSQTSQALGGSGSAAEGKRDPNELLRIAAGKA